MAYTKIKAIRQRMDMSIEYIYRNDKTRYIDDTGQEMFLRGSQNCIQEQAYADMMSTKQRWNKDWGVAGYHIIQSFKAYEVQPQVALEIAARFAEQYLGKYEVAYSAHLDADNIHCHIVFNSVNCMDRGNFADYYKGIRETSDSLCREYGLSVIPVSEQPQGGKHYTERRAEKQGEPTWRDVIRADIDAAISNAGSYGHFDQLRQGKG